MCTEPGEPCQPVHADTSHTYDARLLTVFVALHPVDEVQGPTRMYPGTHADEELHTGLKTLDEASGESGPDSCMAVSQIETCFDTRATILWVIHESRRRTMQC